MIYLDFGYFETFHFIATFLILLGTFIFLIGFVMAFFNIYYGIKFGSYMEKIKYKTWYKLHGKYLNFKQKKPIQIFLNAYRYILNDEDTTDLKILNFKKKLRFGFKTFIFCWSTGIIL